MSFYLKDPQSRVDYAIDWTPYLDGQAIETSEEGVLLSGLGLGRRTVLDSSLRWTIAGLLK